MQNNKTKKGKIIFIIVIILALYWGPKIYMSHNYNDNIWNKATAYKEAIKSAGLHVKLVKTETSKQKIYYVFKSKNFDFEVSIYEGNIGMDPISIDGSTIGGFSLVTKKRVKSSYSYNKRMYDTDNNFKKTVKKQLIPNKLNEEKLNSYFYIYKLNNGKYVVMLSHDGEILGGVNSLATIASEFGHEYKCLDNNGLSVNGYTIKHDYGWTEVVKKKSVERNNYEILPDLDMISLDVFCDIMEADYCIEDNSVDFTSR